jgi:hypothetical protein
MHCRWKACVPALLALLVGSIAQAADSKEVHQTIPLDRDGHLSIENFKGSISVTTWDRPEVEMGVRIDPDDLSSDPKEMEKVALTEVRVKGSGPSVRIQSSYEHLRNHRFLGIFGFDNTALPFVHYSISMPATAHLEIKDYKSDIRVVDLKSDLKLKNYKGIVSTAERTWRRTKVKCRSSSPASLRTAGWRLTRESSTSGCRKTVTFISTPTRGAGAPSIPISSWLLVP